MSQIAGYQVVSHSGELFSPANLILSLETAISRLRIAASDSTHEDEEWLLSVILISDSKGMMFEKPLMNTEDKYSTLCLSTAHLCEEDSLELNRLGSSDENNMFWSRDCGWIVKFYIDENANLEEFLRLNSKPFLSKNYLKIIETAYLAGYRMIDFDSDADISPFLPSF